MQNFRSSNFVAAIRAFAEQYGQGDFRAVQTFFSVDQAGFGTGLKALGLLELVLAVDPGTQAALAQIEHLFGAFQIVVGQVVNDMRLTQIAVGPGHVGGEGQLRGLTIDFGSASLTECSFPGITLAAPQVEVVIETGADVTHGGVGIALPSRVLILGQARTADAGAGVAGRIAFGIGGIRGGAGLMRAGFGDLHVRAVVQRFADQPVELRVAEAGPPVAFWPRGRRQGHAVEGLADFQAFRVEVFVLCVEAAVVGAAGEDHRRQHQGQAGAQGFTAHCVHLTAG